MKVWTKYDIYNVVNEFNRIESEIEILKAERIRQYEAYADGVIGRNEYLTKKSELTEKIETLQDSLDRIRLLLGQGSEIVDSISNINEKSVVYMGYDTLTKEMVDAFVGMVYVYDEHKIEVEFLFDDLLKTMSEKIMKVEDNK